MKKFKVFALVVALFAIVLSSCTSTPSEIADLRSLTENIEQNVDSYTVDDWYAAWESYRLIENELELHESEYSYEQKKEIQQYKSKCYKLFVNSAIGSLKDLIN